MLEDVAGLVSAAFGLLALGAVMLYVRNSTASGALGRNDVIGIRTKVTKSSDLAWKVGHRAAGPWLLAATWIGFVGGSLTICAGVAGAVSDVRGPALLVVPAAGFLGVASTGLIAGKKANEAGRSAADELESR